MWHCCEPSSPICTSAVPLQPAPAPRTVDYSKVAQPFHEGELAAQAKAGQHPPHPPIYAALPEQHRLFYPLLPTLYVGSVDAAGQPWASVVCSSDGRPGFVTSPDPWTLAVEADVAVDDPLHGNLRIGAPLGILGMQAHTRRRNRANGHISRVQQRCFSVSISQAFGNCPQYIQTRMFVPRAAASAGRSVAGGMQQRDAVQHGPLSDAATALVTASDTLFIASAARPADAATDPKAGCDMSHRGGKPGFVRVSDGGAHLALPDFIGNFFMNTLGNLSLEPRCGLLFIDWRSGDVLHVAGVAAVEWEGPRVAAFAGAQRVINVGVTDWTLRHGALCIVEDPTFAVGFSPFLAATSTWATADTVLAAAAAGDVWRNFTVCDVQNETASVRSFTLKPVDGGAVAPHTPGQHLRLKLPALGEGGTERSYTLTAPPNGATLRISVRRQGLASAYLHDSCGVGAVVLCRPPAGRFVLDQSSSRPAVLVSAGIGCTPMLAMLEGALPNNGARASSAAARGLTWVHVARNGAEHPFRDRVEQLCRAGGVRYYVAYTQPRPEDATHFDVAGRLDGRALIDAIGGPEAARTRDWYVCGPTLWWVDVKAALRGAGVRPRQVHTEEFRGGGVVADDPDPVVDAVADGEETVPPSPPPIEEAFAVCVTLARSKRTLMWHNGQAGSLLDAAEALGLQLPYSCRLGLCGTCAAPLLHGRAQYLPAFKSSAQRHDAADRGDVLLCCAVPRAGVRMSPQATAAALAAARVAAPSADRAGDGAGPSSGSGAAADVTAQLNALGTTTSTSASGSAGPQLVVYDGPTFDA